MAESNIFSIMKSQSDGYPVLAASAAKPLTVKDVLENQQALKDMPPDTVIISAKTPEKKKGIVQSFKENVAGFLKARAGIAEYTKGIAGGIYDGAVIGSVLYTGGELAKSVKNTRLNSLVTGTGNLLYKGLKKAGSWVDIPVVTPAAKALLKGAIKFFKAVPAHNKAIAAGAAALALGYNLFNASLNASERKADIDHRWLGHNQ